MTLSRGDLYAAFFIGSKPMDEIERVLGGRNKKLLISMLPYAAAPVMSEPT